MITKDMLLKDNILNPKSALERKKKKSWKQNDCTGSYFKMICRFLHHSLSHQSPLISPPLPFYPPPPPPIQLFSSCTCACFYLRDNSDIEANLETFGSDEAIRLPILALVPLWTTSGWRWGSHAGVALGSPGSGHAQRLVCCGQRMR